MIEAIEDLLDGESEKTIRRVLLSVCEHFDVEPDGGGNSGRKGLGSDSDGNAIRPGDETIEYEDCFGSRQSMNVTAHEHRAHRRG